MKIIKAGYELLTPLDGTAILQSIERAGRVCYKSEEKISPESAHPFVKKLIKNGHEAMIEHFSFTVRFICDRGVSHELVRHRLASFAQESTRYCNYGKQDEITVILPCFFKEGEENVGNQYFIWLNAMRKAEQAYMHLLKLGKSPQEARSVLPNSLKTEVVMTANLREWRHFFKLRTAQAAHPQMREVTIPLLETLKEKIPVIFDDILEN